MTVRNPQRRNERSYLRRKARDRVYRYAGKRNCFLCGSDENITIHHVNGDLNDYSMGNLECLCTDCHRKLHWGNAIL